MSCSKLLVLAACSLPLAILPLQAQNPDAKPKLNVLQGPAKAPLEKIAQVDVPSGYAFIDGKSTRALLKAEGEPVSGPASPVPPSASAAPGQPRAAR